MPSNSTPLHIAFATNGRYVPLALCCLTSILLNASRRNNLHFVLLCDGLTEKEIALFEKALKIFNCAPDQLTVFPLKERLEAMDLPLWRGGKTAWLRLLLPELLPEISHVLYTDVDTLWCCDVQTFASWMKIDTSIAWCISTKQTTGHHAMPTPSSDATISSWYQQEHLPYTFGTYLNSGILVLNLEKLRKGNFSERWQAFLRAHPNPPFVDQDILYSLLKEDVTLLPGWCNWMTQYPKPVPFPAVLHYAGRPHPWNSKEGERLRPVDDIFFFVAFWQRVMVPLYGDDLTPYSTWEMRPRHVWQYHVWHPLQYRFPWLYTLAHHRLIRKAKTSEAKARKLDVIYWDVHWRFLITHSKISWWARKKSYRAWSRALRTLSAIEMP